MISSENCCNCMNSKNSEVSLLLTEFFENDNVICNHINSPYYSRVVTQNNSCRLFEDETKYFNKKDRFEKIEKLNDNSRFNNI